MDIPKKNIPDNSIYKVYLLDHSGDTQSIYLFSNGPLEKAESLFSETEWTSIQENNVPLVYCKQIIHKDDSVRIIKKKIIHEIGHDKITYDEMYLFVNVLETVHIMNLYEKLTKKDSVLLNAMMLKQLFSNMNYTDYETEQTMTILGKKENYNYNDLTKVLKYDENYAFTVPFGQKFSKERDYLYSANPYQLYSNKIGMNSTENALLSFENELLLNYGNIHQNTLYLCTYENTVNTLTERGITSDYITQMYFPLLFRNGITTVEDYADELPNLINQNNKLVDKPTLLLYDTVDSFYKLYYGRTEELHYLEKGIKEFSIRIKSEMNIVLPLEILFKNIHATKTVPFIKYNPGNRRENIYRLYSEQRTRDGKEIPYLNENQILKLSREIGKSRQISLFIQHQIGDGIVNFYLDFENNGDIHIYSSLKKPLLIPELTTLLQTAINPVIDTINSFLSLTGYSIRKIHHLNDHYIEISSIHYVTEINLEKELNFKKYMGCITSVFDVLSESEIDGYVMRFKRVENFREMDAQSMLITDTFKKTNNLAEVLSVLMKNYKMTEDAAKARIVEYLNEHKEIRGKVIDNPGISVQFKISKLEKRLIIDVKDVLHIDYLDIINIYLDSMLRITQLPASSSYSAKEFTNICTLANKLDKQKVDKPHVENIVATTIIEQPTLEMPVKIKPIGYEETEEYEEEEEDEDEGKGLFFGDEDEEEEPYDATGDIAPVTAADGEQKADSKSSTASSENGLFFEDESIESNASERSRRPVNTGGSAVSSANSNSSSVEGSEKEFVINPVGKPLKHPNLFFEMMKKRDPVLFETEENGKYKGYSRACQSSQRRQPVILSKEEFDKINRENPGSYTDYIKYGSNPDDPYYYICPRYWCLLNNTSMTEEDVQAGKCAKRGVPDKIIPQNATSVPSDAFVYEFKNPKEHINEKGEYIPHYPGFIKDNHPKGYGLPCCFKKPKQNWEFNLQDKKGKRVKKPKMKEDRDKNISYIISNETFPIRQKHRFGFLPLAIQLFLQMNNNDYITENNAALIKPNVECMLRYGVEQIPHQSILGSIADLYAHKQKLEEVPSVEELKEIMEKTITLDKFIRYHNSYLVSVFKPKKILRDNIDLSKYENTKFYATIDVNDENQVDFLEDTIASYENFISYLKDETTTIDHTYLWDIICDDNPEFIKGGVNLVIMEITDDDITNNVKLLCPTHSMNRTLYDPRKDTFLLLKIDDFYEPIYMYKEVQGTIYITRTFIEQTSIKNVKNILNIIQKIGNKYCTPLPSLPRVYNFKKNISVEDLYKQLRLKEYIVQSQILNYQHKVIGIVVSADRETEGSHVFIPCYPSAPISEMDDIHEQYMDDDDDSEHPIWNDYTTTVNSLNHISKLTNNKILCQPKFKVMEDNLIIGVLTETNQFIQIDPPSENIQYDELPVLQSSNYLIADKIVTTSKKQDVEREHTIKKISLESNFYSLFRSTIRKLLIVYDHKLIRDRLTAVVDNKRLMYYDKLKKVIAILKELTKDKISFDLIETEVLMKYNELSCMAAASSFNQCENNEYCIQKEDGKCMLVIPKNHLISGVDNERVYFGRVADELIRFNRIRLFMLQPKNFLNISNTEYKIDDNEFIIIQTAINNEYLKDLKPYNVSSYIENVNYETAEPQLTQTYSTEPVTVEEQYANLGLEKTNLNELLIECIDKTIEIIGNPRDSIWKRIFPKKAKEIVFKNTSPQCSFYVLIAMFQDKYKEPLSVLSVKEALWGEYNKYYNKYSDRILELLKKQGKRTIVGKIQDRSMNLETAIMSTDYYITDLDIWMFAQHAKIQTCIFNRNLLKGLNEDLEWLILGKAYNEKHYFIRSPPLAGPNKIPSYHLISGSYSLGELREFETIVQNAVSGRSAEYTQNVETIQSFLDKRK